MPANNKHTSLLNPLRSDIDGILDRAGVDVKVRRAVGLAFGRFTKDRVLAELDVHFRVLDGQIVPLWEVTT